MHTVPQSCTPQPWWHPWWYHVALRPCSYASPPWQHRLLCQALHQHLIGKPFLVPTTSRHCPGDGNELEVRNELKEVPDDLKKPFLRLPLSFHSSTLFAKHSTLPMLRKSLYVTPLRLGASRRQHRFHEIMYDRLRICVVQSCIF